MAFECVYCINVLPSSCQKTRWNTEIQKSVMKKAVHFINLLLLPLQMFVSSDNQKQYI